MKRKIWLIASVFLTFEIKAQISDLDNTSTNTADFVGWSPTVSFALNINHKANTAASDINFLTRNTQRMILDDNGRLGLGLVNPSALLQLGRTATSLGNLFRTDGLSNEVTQWQLFTGATLGTATERFRLYAEAMTTPWIGLQSLSNGLRFETAGAFQRMRINGSQTNTSINGINNINTTGFVTALHRCTV
jgi:hypothetical protein